ncbi:hypothetical protein BGX31_008074 [Mortierella sp. GBA43]|nr:hypothetical protein BGX31_008074 [Mortierella sp. GBA43]
MLDPDNDMPHPDNQRNLCLERNTLNPLPSKSTTRYLRTLRESCGQHTSSSNNAYAHEIHFADHPGYDIDEHCQDAFFDKYGPYLLTLMYTFKWSTIVRGRIVSKASGTLLSSLEETIAYLEVSIHVDEDTMVNGHWAPSASMFESLGMFLKINEGEDRFGHLNQITCQDRHSVWVCHRHQSEYQESVRSKLEHAITDSGGEYTEQDQRRVTIKITSAYMKRQFYKALPNVRWTQYRGKKTFTPLELELGDGDFKTHHLVIDLNDFDLLVLDFESLLIKCGRFQDGAPYFQAVVPLSTFTEADGTVVSQCRLSHITIMNGPVTGDALTDMLYVTPRSSMYLTGCPIPQVASLIRIVTTAADLSYELTSLRMDIDGVSTGVGPSLRNCGPIVSSAAPADDVDAIDDNDPLYRFFKHWGSPIKPVAGTFNHRLVLVLDRAIHKQGSCITKPKDNPHFLTSSGSDGLSRIVASSSLLALDLVLQCPKGCFQRKVRFLDKDSDKPRSIYHQGIIIPEGCIPWIITMISAPSLEQLPTLKGVKLSGSILRHKQWKYMIRAIDFTDLEELDFSNTNMSCHEVKCVRHRIRERGARSLKSIIVADHVLTECKAQSTKEKLCHWAPGLCVIRKPITLCRSGE